jgi:hypothetical protein
MLVKDAIGFSKEVMRFDPDLSLPMPDLLMGVELEYEGMRGAADSVLWSRVSDGSLRNSGIEYVFTDPLYGTGITMALDNMQETLTQQPPTVTDRCSVHVHMNVSDMDMDQLLSLIILYLIFEKTLVKYHGGNREDNIFCVPFYKAPQPLDNLYHLFKSGGSSISTTQAVFNQFVKYNAFNIGAIMQHGSVEFRHMAGTADMSKVLDWIKIIQHLKRAAVTMPVNYFEIINNMSGSSTLIIEDVFQDDADLLRPHATSDDIIAGARLAQKILNRYKLEQASLIENNRRRNKATTDKIVCVRGKLGKTIPSKAATEGQVNVDEGANFYTASYGVGDTSLNAADLQEMVNSFTIPPAPRPQRVVNPDIDVIVNRARARARQRNTGE